MTKENVIDLTDYRDRRQKELSNRCAPISQELETAIEDLIYQLRELGPIQTTN